MVVNVHVKGAISEMNCLLQTENKTLFSVPPLTNIAMELISHFNIQMNEISTKHNVMTC